MSDIRTKLDRLLDMLRGERRQEYTQSLPNETIMVNVDGDCGLYARADGTAELQSRRATVAVSDDIVAILGNYMVVGLDSGVHFAVPRDGFFVDAMQLSEKTIGGQAYVVPKDDSSLDRMFKDPSDRPVPFREVFGLHKVFDEPDSKSPHKQLADRINKVLRRQQ